MPTRSDYLSWLTSFWSSESDPLARTCKKQVAEVMSRIDRAHYSKHTRYPYSLDPEPITEVRYDSSLDGSPPRLNTSAPPVIAEALFQLVFHHHQQGTLEKVEQVADIGSGCGYVAACMGLLFPKVKRVHVIERVKVLFEEGRQNIFSDSNFPNSQSLFKFSNVNALDVNCLIESVDGEKKLDAVHMGTAHCGIPESIRRTLKPGGLFIFPETINASNSQITKKTFNEKTPQTGLSFDFFMPMVQYLRLYRKELQEDGNEMMVCLNKNDAVPVLYVEADNRAPSND